MIYSFDGVEVDTDRLQVLRDGAPEHVEPQVFDVLCYLIEHRDRVVTKLELFDEIWGGAFVGESTLTSRIKSARRVVGDNGQAQRVIRTVHRRGYQFVGDVLERDTDPPLATSPSEIIGRTPGPSGTVTFLFTDIQGSSRLWELHPDEMTVASARHDELLHTAVAEHDGVVFATAGDGVAAAFRIATDAMATARQIRSTLEAERWPDPVELRVRIGIHTGEAVERGGDYLGATVNRAARVMSAAHGGQTLISDAAAGVIDDDGLVDLGICQIDPSMPSMRLWQVDGPRFPAPAGAIASPLPSLRTELIGRVADLERVADALAEHRLVSIVGPGGAGKTTLALAAANSVLVSFPSGVVFVELASVNDGGGIPRAIAEAAGVEGAAASDVSSLTTHIARRPILLVLDNCEHLLDECAEFIDDLLDAGSEATVLTTSREPHGVDGEIVLPLGSLQAAAPELFVVRARAAARGLAVAVDDARVTHLCTRLDGLPLAIELAAAQLAHLGLDDLVSRLDASLELSKKGRSRAGGRHLTLDRTIAWSYDLLDESGRWLLRQFGVFPGSFDLATAEAVGARQGWATIVPTLSDLVAKNLLTRDETNGRYRLLETIRAFADQRLTEAGEHDVAAERLRSHVVRRATALTRVDRWFSGQNAASLRADLDNIRFAFDQSMWSGRTVEALELHIGCCFLFRNTLSCTDGRRWAARLEPVEADFDPVDRLWSTLVRADLAQGTADHETGARSAAEAVQLAEQASDATALVIARQSDALHYVVIDPDEALARLDHALELAEPLDDPRLERLLRAFVSVTELSAGRTDRGMEIAEEVGHEATGDGYDVFIANWAAWTGCLIRGDAERLRYWRERQRTYLSSIAIPEPWMFLWSTALNHAMEGDDPIAGLRQARVRADSEGHDIAADVILALVVIELLAGRRTEAAELLGLVMRSRLNNLSHYVLARTLRTRLRESLDHDTLTAAMRRGARRDADETLDARGLSLDEPTAPA
jgi:predicted ATPase/class 3 adenylate cyclase